jgi:hypothetical protein
LPTIAISYRRQDSEAITGRIFDRLTFQYGKDAIFRDIDNIPAGVDFREHINDVLGNSALLVVIMGRRWLGGARTGTTRLDDEMDMVRIEVETALRLDIPIIPVLVDNANMPSTSMLPESIRPLAFRNAIRIDSGQDFDNHIERLLRSVEGTLPEKPLSPRPPPSHIDSFLNRRLLLVSVGLLAVVGVAAVVYLQRWKPKPASEFATTQPTLPSTSRSLELTTAIGDKRPEALKAYLDKYPDDPDRSDLLDKLGALIRSEFTEWSIFEIAIQLNKPIYLQISSIEQVKQHHVMVLTRAPLDRSLPAYIRDVPDGAYQQALDVYDCDTPAFWDTEVTYYSKANDVIYHYKWADPGLVERVAEPMKIAEGSISASTRHLVCDEQLRTPTITKDELSAFKFASLSSMPAGDGDLFYKIVKPKIGGSDPKVLLISQFHEKKKLSDASGPNTATTLQELTFIISINLLRIDCKNRRSTGIKGEYYTETNSLVGIFVADPTKPGAVADINPKSPLGLLHEIACAENN